MGSAAGIHDSMPAAAAQGNCAPLCCPRAAGAFGWRQITLYNAKRFAKVRKRVEWHCDGMVTDIVS